MKQTKESPRNTVSEADGHYILLNKCPLINCLFKGITRRLATFEDLISRFAIGLAYEKDAPVYCPNPCNWFKEESRE